MDTLKHDIRQLLCERGPLDRDTVAMLLLEMLERIEKLEAAHGIKE